MTLNTTSAQFQNAQTQADWTLDRLLTTSTRDLDDLFRAAPAGGQMPGGDSRGMAILGNAAPVRRFWAGFARLFCWQGKVFDRQDEQQATLVNKILPIGIRGIKARVYRGPSRLDGRECIVLDYSQTSLLARWIRDEIREVAPGIYMGMVYWGGMSRPMLRFALDVNHSTR